MLLAKSRGTAKPPDRLLQQSLAEHSLWARLYRGKDKQKTSQGRHCRQCGEGAMRASGLTQVQVLTEQTRNRRLRAEEVQPKVTQQALGF